MSCKKILSRPMFFFTDYVLYWLETAKIRIEKITYEGYASVVKLHIIPYFKSLKIPLKKIKREDIQKYQRKI